MHAIDQLECHYQLQQPVATEVLQAFTNSHILATIGDVFEVLERELNVWGVPVNCSVDRVTIDLAMSEFFTEGHSQSHEYCQQIYTQLRQAIIDALPREHVLGLALRSDLDRLQAAFNAQDSASIIQLLPLFLAKSASSALFYLAAQQQLTQFLVHELKNTQNQWLVANMQSDACVFSIISIIEPRYASDIIALIQSELIHVAGDNRLLPALSSTATPTPSTLPLSTPIPASRSTLTTTPTLTQTEAIKAKHVASRKANSDTEQVTGVRHDAAARKRLIQFSLAYLACERGSEFNRKSYLRSVIRQLADHDNVSVKTVCQQLYLASKRCVLTPKIQTDLNAIIQLELQPAHQRMPIFTPSTVVESQGNIDLRCIKVSQLKTPTATLLSLCIARLQGGQCLDFSLWQQLFDYLQREQSNEQLPPTQSRLIDILINDSAVRTRFLTTLPNQYQYALLSICLRYRGLNFVSQKTVYDKTALTVNSHNYRAVLERLLLTTNNAFLHSVNRYMSAVDAKSALVQPKTGQTAFDALLDGAYAAKHSDGTTAPECVNNSALRALFESRFLQQLRTHPQPLNQRLHEMINNRARIQAMVRHLSVYALERLLLSLNKHAAESLKKYFPVVAPLITLSHKHGQRSVYCAYWSAALITLLRLDQSASKSQQPRLKPAQGFQLHDFLLELEAHIIALQFAQFIYVKGQCLSDLNQALAASGLASVLHHDVANALNRGLSTLYVEGLNTSHVAPVHGPKASNASVSNHVANELASQTANRIANPSKLLTDMAFKQLSAAQSRVLSLFAELLLTGRRAVNPSDWQVLDTINYHHSLQAIRQCLTATAVRQRFLSLIPPDYQQSLISRLFGQLPTISGMWLETSRLYRAIMQPSQNDGSAYKQHTGAVASELLPTNRTAYKSKIHVARPFTEASLGRVVRVFILEYLSNDRGSVFNQRSFARALLRQISAHFNLNYTDLLHSLQSALADQADADLVSVFGELVQSPVAETGFLSDDGVHNTVMNSSMDNSTSKGKPVELAKPTVVKRSLLEGARLYDMFFTMLGAAERYSPSAWQRVLRSLREHYPRYAYRLLREWQRGGVNIWQHANQLSEQVAQLILDNILFITGHKHSKADGGIGRAITQYARQSLHPLFFYLASADAVLTGGMIDLDAVERDVQTRLNGTRPRPKSELLQRQAPGIAHTGSATLNEVPEQLDKPVNVLSKVTREIFDHQLDLVSLADSTVLEKQARALVKQILAQGRVEAFAAQPEHHQLRVLALVDRKKLAQLWPLVQRLHTALLQCINTRLTAALHAMLVQTVLELISDAHAIVQRDFLIQLVLHRFAKLTQAFSSSAAQQDFKQWQDQLSRALLADLSLPSARSQNTNSNSHSVVQHQLVDCVQSMSSADIRLGPLTQPRLSPSVDTALPSSAAESEQPEAQLSVDDEQQELTKLIEDLALDDDPLTKLPDAASLIEVAGAGVVLLAPYLPMLFDKLALLNDGRFANALAQRQALQCLIYLCTGEARDQSYTVSLLHALICGFQLSELHTAEALLHKDQGEGLSVQACNLCDDLLNGVIGHWQALGNTRIEGLREVFLQRRGQLTFEEEKGWLLNVESRAFDVMLKRLPWGFSALKHGFMNDCIFVEWG